MTVLTVTIVDQAFNKKSSEVDYLQRVIDTLKNEIGRAQGTPSPRGQSSEPTRRERQTPA